MTTVLLAATLLALLAAPRLLARTAQDALRAAVVAAGDDATVVVSTAGTTEAPPGSPPLEAATAEASALDQQLDAMHPAVVVASSPDYAATVGGAPLTARLVALEVPTDRDAAVRWVAGRAPAAAPPPADDPVLGGPAAPVEVGLAVDVAQALGVDPSAAPVPVPLRMPRSTTVREVLVSGLYEPVDRADVRWTLAPDLLAVPRAADDGAAGVVALLVPPETQPDMAAFLGTRLLTATTVAVLDTEQLTVAGTPVLARDVRTFLATTPEADSALPQVLDAFAAHHRATLAQASLVVVGVGATAGCVLVLAGTLLVERRRSHLAGERARGASAASVALRAAVEVVPLVAVAVGAAVAAVTWWLPDLPGSSWPVVALAAVGLVAPPLLAARAATRAWAGRRVPADRRDRARVAAVRGARRVVAELTVLVVAVGAAVLLRARGVVASDALAGLAGAPFLLAAAAALVVARVAPAAVRAATRLAARGRGLAGVLAAARAQRGATALLPLATVTVAVALVVLSGVLVQTVRDGQRLAADQLVAADVRLDGPLGTDEARAALDRLATADGVTALATGTQLTQRAFGRGSEPTATVLLVDAAALARVRDARGLPVDPGLAALGNRSDGALPALASPGLLERVDVSDGTQLQLVTARTEVDVRGRTSLTGDDGPPPADARAAHAVATGDDGVVVVDAAAAAAVAARLPAPTRAWVVGPGAERAVAASGLADLRGVTVTTADGWWRAWSRAPLPVALTTLLLVAAGVLTVLCVAALALVVVATSGERGRTLSTLRTLGLDGRTARWVTLGELAPLVVGGLVGGVAIGWALPHLLGDALGLAWVTAAPGAVPVADAWWPALLATGAVAAAVAVALVVEQHVRRRERLGDVLRVGAR